MNTIIKEQNGELCAILDGRLDTAAAIQTEKDMQPLFNSNGKNVVLDCNALQYISSSGLRIFLSVLKNTKPRGCHVYISGLNDDLLHAKKLAQLLHGLQCRVNLIRFHESEEAPYKTSLPSTIAAFQNFLNRNGVICTLRASRGQDIDAACGLLSTAKQHNIETSNLRNFETSK